MKENVKDMTVEELEAFFQSIGEPKFRAKQVFSWMYKGVSSFEEMTNLSKALREKLEEKAELACLKIREVQTSRNDGTKKYLFQLADGNTIESVLMQYKFGNTICVSSQAGCRMGCDFCASTKGGLKRNLTAGEIADQLISIEQDAGITVSNVVVMGTGEPFDNYDNLCRFIELVHHKDGLNLGLRSITVSTCGIIPKIKRFAEDYPQVNLAISLHGPDEEIRSRLMPVNKSYPLDQLIPACREYAKETGRRVTYEYALIEDVNDQEEHARKLAAMLSGSLCHINLIPLNKISGAKYSGASKKTAERFKALLEKKGVPATLRREMGSDIAAACGQLRLNTEKN